jgi:hypothetical protein
MIGTLATPSASKSSTLIADADSSNQLSKPESTSVKTSSDQDPEQIKKVFKWFLWGWVAFFVLAYMAIDVKRGIELIASVFFGVGAALVSTLIYWGIREFLKSNADKDRRADAAESEIAELRRKVDELSRKSED